MNEEQKNKTLKESVLNKIKAGQAIMKPKWQFVLKASLMVVGFLILVLAALYIFSFILFVLRHNGSLFLPAFGFRGWGLMLMSFPWLLVIAGIVFIVILELMVRHYSFAYRKPLLYSLLGIIIFVGIAGIVVAKTSLHDALYHQAEKGELPIAGPWYILFGIQEGRHFDTGSITKITDDGFKFHNDKNEDIDVEVTSETQFPYGVDFQKGDRVLIMGERSDDTIEAIGIRRIDSGMMPQRPPKGAKGWFHPNYSPMTAPMMTK